MPLIWLKDRLPTVMDVLRTNYFGTLAVALFKNNIIPNDGMTLADFTEAAFPGYAPQSLSTPNPAFLNAGGAGEVDADLVTFTATGPSAETVFGYFVYDIPLHVVVAQRFAAPIPMMNNGDALDVGVKFIGFSQFAG